MDVEAVFANFLKNAVNLQPATRCHNAIVTGLSCTFSDLMVLSDEDMDQFVSRRCQPNNHISSLLLLDSESSQV
jgi:hypothetical protein